MVDRRFDRSHTGAEASERNVAALGLVVQAVNARKVPRRLLAPDFRMENRVTAAADAAYEGERGWQEWLDDLLLVFEENALYGVEEIIEAGDGHVIARFRLSGRSAHTHELLAFSWVGVTWFRDGRATRAVGYPSAEEAALAVARGLAR